MAINPDTDSSAVALPPDRAAEASGETSHGPTATWLSRAGGHRFLPSLVMAIIGVAFLLPLG